MDEFEVIAVEIHIKEWETPNVTRCGRQGQAQQGVDVYGNPKRLDGGTSGVQCKNVKKLTWQIVKASVEAAKKFKPKLAEFTIATTAEADSALQEKIRTHKWPFPVSIRFWGDLSLAISRYPDLLERLYPGWVQKRTTQAEVRDLLLGCDPEDFRTILKDGNEVQVCKKDVRLTIVQEDLDEDGSGGTFSEPWIQRFPANAPAFGGSPAHQYQISIEFEGTRVWSHRWVLVDGGRYLLPMPESMNSLRIDEFQAHLVDIVNAGNNAYSLDEALDTAGFEIVPKHKGSDKDWLKPARQSSSQGADTSRGGTLSCVQPSKAKSAAGRKMPRSTR